MFLTVVRETAELLLIIVGLYAVAFLIVARRKHWAIAFAKRRLRVLLLIATSVLLLKVTEDVVSHESGVIDEALLRWIHLSIPGTFDNVFQAITLTGSAKVLLPLASLATVVLLARRKRFEAALLATTALAATMVVYVAKAAVARTRPELWETQWYWGSSFPSGHTLTTAALATAAVICVGRLWPPARRAAVLAACLWVGLVALSRMVLGVHWPTDVLAAACAGGLLAVGVNTVMDAWRPGRWQDGSALRREAAAPDGKDSSP